MKAKRPSTASRKLMKEQERADDYRDYLARKEQERKTTPQGCTAVPASQPHMHHPEDMNLLDNEQQNLAQKD